MEQQPSPINNPCIYICHYFNNLQHECPWNPKKLKKKNNTEIKIVVQAGTARFGNKIDVQNALAMLVQLESERNKQ